MIYFIFDHLTFCSSTRQAAARTYGPSSFSEGGALKPLWDKIAGAITAASTPGVGCLLGVPPVQPGGDAEYACAQEVVDMIQVMSTLAPCLEGDALSASLSLLPHVISLCSSRFGAVRQVCGNLDPPAPNPQIPNHQTTKPNKKNPWP